MNRSKILNSVKFLEKEKNEKIVIVGLENVDDILFVRTVASGNNEEAYISFDTIKKVLKDNKCKNFIMIHNHPDSEYIMPSKDDDDITKKYRALSKEYGYNMLDHIIVGNASKYFSYRDYGWVYDANDFISCVKHILTTEKVPFNDCDLRKLVTN